jgi:hypothetical protein
MHYAASCTKVQSRSRAIARIDPSGRLGYPRAEGVLSVADQAGGGSGRGGDFDATLYGMPATYDKRGHYNYPEGFNPETGEWLPGYETQREQWERKRAELLARFEEHRRKLAEARARRQ